MYSYKQIKESLPVSKNKVSAFWVRLWVRKASYFLTYIMINLGITANQASIISAAVAFGGCVLLSINNRMCMITGVVLINLWIVFDCVDGNIARVKKESSYVGEFFDAVCGYVLIAFVFLSIGVAAFHTSDFLGEYQYVMIIIGAVAAVSDLYSRLIYQKYTYTSMVIAQEQGIKYTSENDNFEKEVKPTGFTMFRLVLDRQLGMSGLFMPWLIISCVFNKFEYMVVFYALYHFCALMVVFVMYLKKATRLKAQ